MKVSLNYPITINGVPTTACNVDTRKSEDEGFGDSTKTIKRGQGSHLARSVSLKLSPRVDLPKPLGTTTEVSENIKGFLTINSNPRNIAPNIVTIT